jgi:hypothetical protein
MPANKTEWIRSAMGSEVGTISFGGGPRGHRRVCVSLSILRALAHTGSSATTRSRWSDRYGSVCNQARTKAAKSRHGDDGDGGRSLMSDRRNAPRLDFERRALEARRLHSRHVLGLLRSFRRLFRVQPGWVEETMPCRTTMPRIAEQHPLGRDRLARLDVGLHGVRHKGDGPIALRRNRQQSRVHGLWLCSTWRRSAAEHYEFAAIILLHGDRLESGSCPGFDPRLTLCPARSAPSPAERGAPAYANARPLACNGAAPMGAKHKSRHSSLLGEKSAMRERRFSCAPARSHASVTGAGPSRQW